MTFDPSKYQAFPPLRKTDRRWPDRTIECAPAWCAVDLRDGNQALIKPMTVEQKLRLFRLLVEIGFKEIEVGFPAASQPDFDFVRRIFDEGLVPDDVRIQVLTQSREDLMTRTFEALRGAKRATVHLYNSTSPVQRDYVFNLDRAGIIDIAVRGAKWVKQYAAAQPETDWEFEYSPESFTSTELPFALEIVDAVNDVWRPDQGQKVVINLPATVEVSTPNIYADMIEWMIDNMKYRSHVRLSVHTHNDRGSGVAAAELAVMAGADRVEGTLLGNGERTGNTDLITMAMNLYSQGVDPKLDLSQMHDIVAVVEDCTEIRTHPRHPYAGELVFTAFSGSHQDAIRKSLAHYEEGKIWNVAYLPIDPHDLGRRYEEVVRINSQSGKGGVLHVLERDFGITLPRWLQIDFAKVVQREAERTGGELEAARIRELFDRSYLELSDKFRLNGYDLGREGERVHAEVSLLSGERLEGEGRGVVEALVDALTKTYGLALRVDAFDEAALGQGTDARAMACVRLHVGSASAAGVALAEDTTSAALQAVLAAGGRLISAANGAAQATSARKVSSLQPLSEQR
jgi:2-isopropylmalate synthase